MLEDIKNDFLIYVADKYYDDNWTEIEGEGAFNKYFEDDIKLYNFSAGRFRNVANDFLLVQLSSVSGNRETLPNLGTVDWGSVVTLNVYIERSITPDVAAYVSDKYIARLYDLFQTFVYNYRRYTPVSPQASITKYYSASGSNALSDFNSITKLIVSGDLTFTCKKNDLTLEEVL